MVCVGVGVGVGVCVCVGVCCVGGWGGALTRRPVVVEHELRPKENRSILHVVAANPIPFACLRTRPVGVHRACRQANKDKKPTHTHSP